MSMDDESQFLNDGTAQLCEDGRARFNFVWNNPTWLPFYYQEGRGVPLMAVTDQRRVEECESTEGPRTGEKCVCKRFKHGYVYDASFYDQDIAAMIKAGSFLAGFNRLKWTGERATRQILMNCCEVWQDIHPNPAGKYARCLVEPFKRLHQVQFQHGLPELEGGCRARRLDEGLQPLLLPCQSWRVSCE